MGLGGEGTMHLIILYVELFFQRSSDFQTPYMETMKVSDLSSKDTSKFSMIIVGEPSATIPFMEFQVGMVICLRSI